MGVIPFYQKRPQEKFSIGLDFTDEMPPSTTLSSGACSAIKRRDGSTATSALLASGTTTTNDTANNIAKIVVEAGDAGSLYEVKFLMTLNNGHKLEGLALVMVDE